MGSNSHKLVDISGDVKRETDKAFHFYDGARTEWIPKSQCEWDPDDNTMTMPEWLAIDKGFV